MSKGPRSSANAVAMNRFSTPESGSSSSIHPSTTGSVGRKNAIQQQTKKMRPLGTSVRVTNQESASAIGNAITVVTATRLIVLTADSTRRGSAKAEVQ